MIGLILAGGLGRKLKPITDVIPKPFILIKGKPLVEFAIEKLKRSYKIDKIILITRKEYEEWTYQLERKHYILETRFDDCGKIGTIRKILEEERKDIIVFPADNFIDFEINDFVNYVENKKKFYVLAVDTKNREEAKKYEIVEVNEEDLVIYYEDLPKEPKTVKILTRICYIPKDFCLDYNVNNFDSLFEILFKEKKLYAYVKEGLFVNVDELEDLQKVLKIVKIEKENKLWEAYKYAKEKYYIKLRKNRIPYIEHPIALIGFLRIFTNDEDVLIEALLHDVIEEGKGKYDEIRERFGERIAKVTETLNEGYEEIKEEEKLVRFFDTLHNFLTSFSEGSYKIHKYVEKKINRSLIEDFKGEVKYFKKYLEKRKPVKEIYIDPNIYDEIKDELKIYEDDYRIKIECPKRKDVVFIGKQSLTENSYYYDKRFKNCTLQFLLEKII